MNLQTERCSSKSLTEYMKQERKLAESMLKQSSLQYVHRIVDIKILDVCQELQAGSF
jgi:predicted metal-binding transcription factor (methanogenesis marker protein 9)